MIALAIILQVGLAQAQQAPLVTPRDLRPQNNAAPAVQLPESAPSEVPAGADKLFVQVGDVQLAGGFAALTPTTDALIGKIRGRRVSVADFYRLGNAIELLYHEAGYPLVRIVIPPQSVVDGGTLHLNLVDGYIERVDVKALPGRAQQNVADTLQGLVGRHPLTEAALERAVTLAGRAPGLTLRSTLAPGVQPGGVVLVLDGQQSLVTGSYSLDNKLSKSLGLWESTLQLALNEPLGYGEQFYGYLSAEPNWLTGFSKYAPRRVAGGGVTVPIGTDGLSINPEFTWSDTQPIVPSALVLKSRSLFERYTLRLTYPLILDHVQALTLTGTFDATSQIDSAPQFGAVLDRDRDRVIRLGADWSDNLPGAAQLHATATLSKGLNIFNTRTQAQALASGIGLSRQGENPDFVNVEGSITYAQPLPYDVQSTLTARAQSGLGNVLPSAELFTLDGDGALSLFTEGALAGDSGWTLREQVARPSRIFPALADLVTSPYVFAAVGEYYNRLGANPSPGLDQVYGGGVSSNWRAFAVSLEFGHRFSQQPGLSGNQVFVGGHLQF